MKSILSAISILCLFSLFAYSQEYTREELAKMSLRELMNVEVTSVSKIEENLRKSPAVVSVINHEMIRNYGYRTIYDVLLDIPGFSPIQDVNDKIIGVRGVHGSTNQKFLLLINGHRITESLWNLTDIDYNISLENVKQIEIIRGPGSAIYGRAALTAVINVVTFSGQEIDGLQLDLSLGNHGYRKAGFLFGTQDKSDNEIEVFGHFATTTGEEIQVSPEYDGARNPVSGIEIVDRHNFPTGGFGSRWHNDKWEINLHWQQRNYTQPRASGGQLNWQDVKTNNYFSEAFEKRLLGEEHNFLVFDIERMFSGERINHTLLAGYTFSRLRVREITIPFRDITFGPQAGLLDSLNYGLGEMFEFDLPSSRYGIDYFGDYRFGNNSTAIWGFEAYETIPVSDKFVSNYIARIDESTNQLVKDKSVDGYFRELPGGVFDKFRKEQQISAFAEFRFPLFTDVTVNLGGRFDLHIKGQDYKQSTQDEEYPDPLAEEKRNSVEKTSHQFCPRVALIYLPDDDQSLIAKLLYNRSFIAPSYFYRYSNPATNYSGGPWLNAETLDNILFSVEKFFNDLQLRAVGFLNINRDLLTRDNGMVPARYVSLGNLAMHGIEFDGAYKSTFFSLNGSYAYLAGNKQFSDKTSAASWIMDENSIKNFPMHSGSIGGTVFLLQQTLNITLNNRWHGQILSPITSGQDSGSVITLKSVFTSNLTVRYLPGFLEDFEVSASAYNLFDKKYRLGGSVNIPYFQAGRWLNVSLVKRFK